jgi:capsid protein
MTWRRIPRETAWGALMSFTTLIMNVVHSTGVTDLHPVIQRLKMLVKYDESELEAAILNAIFAAYIESPYDPEMVQAALGENFDDTSLVHIRTDVSSSTKTVG